MDRSVVQQLVHSIVEFLRYELSEASGSALGEESAESVEVAVQCLETAYHLTSTPATNLNLYNVYREAAAAAQSSTSSTQPQQQSSSSSSRPLVTPEAKAEAEILKMEGNTKMREEKFAESLQSYNKAIEKDPTNAVYYCNRAAAHSKLQDHNAAIQDCQKALQLEPNYSKAFGRMGLAHSSLEQHREARDCYSKALELEPDNEGYASNLAIAEEKLLATPAAPVNPFAGLLSGGAGGLAGLAGAFSSDGTPDLAGFLQNPALMNMATQLMSDPNMQNIMTNILGSGAGGILPTATASASASFSTTVPPPAAAAPPPPPPAAAATGGAAPTPGQPEGFPGIDALLTAGRHLAEQIQNQHPELLQHLRTQIGQPPNQPPPPPQP